MNRYEQYISDFLAEYKEISLEKIGVVKTSGGHVDEETQSLPVDFKFDKNAITTPELVDFIASRTGKLKMLIASDLESHLKQAREFINIGKTYEIINAGFIKKNIRGEYELIPYSQALKAQKNFNKPVTKSVSAKRNNSAVQIFTLLIVLAILGGLGYEAYQFFLKPTPPNETETTGTDSTKKNDTALSKDTSVSTANKSIADTTQTKAYNNGDSVLIDYIFETTSSLDRAKAITAQLKNFGNNAGYDSTQTDSGKVYSLFIYKPTKLVDTVTTRDSIAKFLGKSIKIKIADR